MRKTDSNRSRFVGLAPNAIRALLALALIATLAACGSVAEVPAGPVVEAPAPDAPIGAAEWVSVDIGAVHAPGATDIDADGSVRMVSGGEDAWSSADAIRFMYIEMTGAVELIARVDAIEATDAWAKAGLMLRHGVEPGDRNVFLPLTRSGGTVLQARAQDDAPTVDTLPSGIVMHDAGPTAPWWLRLVREGSTVVGFISADGGSWRELGRVEVDLGDRVLVGLAVSTHDSASVATARFSKVRIHGPLANPAPTPAPEPEPEPQIPAEGWLTAAFDVDPNDVRNPERGWYVEPWNANYAAAAAGGDTLAMRYVRLDDFRDRSLPSALLTQLDDEFAAARSAGVKVVLRFAYNRTFGPDAPIDVVLEHITQLTPVLRDNGDVIAVVQAGFIGAWGEWHSSTNGLTDLANRQLITDALLDTVGSSRMVQLRYPYYAREQYPNAGAPENAFTGTASSRVGLMNDCVLANGTDGGTYLSDADWSFTATVSRTTPMGGETCDIGGLSDRNGCANALAELNAHNWDYLNREFFRDVLDRWQAEGCYDEIARRVGYRFVLESASVAATVAPGTNLDLSLTIRNEGFGKLFNPRPMEIVLVPRTGGAPLFVRVATDVRGLMPLSSEARTLDLDVPLPSQLAPGSYDVHVFLPDGAESLRLRPAYAVRFANVGTWETDSGFNDLGLTVSVASGR